MVLRESRSVLVPSTSLVYTAGVPAWFIAVVLYMYIIRVCNMHVYKAIPVLKAERPYSILCLCV